MVVQQSWGEYVYGLARFCGKYISRIIFDWPEFLQYSVSKFQEYTEEFRDIAKGIKSKEALPTAPITLINQRAVDEDLHVSWRRN